MARIKSSGNETTELRFIVLLRAAKITGWRRQSKLFGKPDFVFSRAKVAVFIDGDFWHGNPKKQRLPKSNRSYWKKKITSNKKRDALVNKILRREGWTVIRFWESELRKPTTVCGRLAKRLQAQAEGLGKVALMSAKSACAPSSSNWSA